MRRVGGGAQHTQLAAPHGDRHAVHGREQQVHRVLLGNDVRVGIHALEDHALHVDAARCAELAEGEVARPAVVARADAQAARVGPCVGQQVVRAVNAQRVGLRAVDGQHQRL
ncbi:hypothetical protein D9M69_663020 [compost metagenome]